MTFDARDPKWNNCLMGCRPAVGLHRTDCPNLPDAAHRLRDEVARLEEYLPPSPERDADLSHLREQIRRYHRGNE